MQKDKSADPLQGSKGLIQKGSRVPKAADSVPQGPQRRCRKVQVVPRPQRDVRFRRLHLLQPLYTYFQQLVRPNRVR